VGVISETGFELPNTELLLFFIYLIDLSVFLFIVLMFSLRQIIYLVVLI